MLKKDVMRRIFRFLLAVAISLCLAGVAFSSTGTAADISRATLQNGLQVVIVRDSLAPVVTTMVTFKQQKARRVWKTFWTAFSRVEQPRWTAWPFKKPWMISQPEGEHKVVYIRRVIARSASDEVISSGKPTRILSVIPVPARRDPYLVR
jgi:hypothetical protein